ncbi:MAG: hypothetical protein EBY24_07600 [Betaproteobacteria bacterium]|nr:hypothetical protein [Betaproteobacteria bacterium]
MDCETCDWVIKSASMRGGDAKLPAESDSIDTRTVILLGAEHAINAVLVFDAGIGHGILERAKAQCCRGGVAVQTLSGHANTDDGHFPVYGSRHSLKPVWSGSRSAPCSRGRLSAALVWCDGRTNSDCGMGEQNCHHVVSVKYVLASTSQSLFAHWGAVPPDTRLSADTSH